MFSDHPRSLALAELELVKSNVTVTQKTITFILYVLVMSCIRSVPLSVFLAFGFSFLCF